MKDVWEILGIAPTENKREIKKAYAKMLAKYHPEDHPDEFIEIQNAYQSIMNSLERDYQKPKGLSIDLTEGFHKKDTIYLDTPFVEPDAKNDFEGDFVQQGPYPDLDVEIIHEEKPKQEDAPLYDDLDLSWSFQNQDHKIKKKQETLDLNIDIIHEEKPKQEEKNIYDDSNLSLNHDVNIKKEYVKEVYKQEEIEIKQNTNEQDLKDFLYLRFVERINFSCRTDIMKALILNQTFFDAIGDEQFYTKITALIRKNYNRFDSVATSFLYDAFSYIETNLNYSSTDENSITNLISAEKLRAQREKIRKQKAEKRSIYIFIVCMFVGIMAIQLIIKEQRREKKEKQEQLQEIIRDTVVNKEDEKEEVIEAMRQNKETLETYMLETYGSAYTCSLVDLSYKPNSSIFFYCDEVQNVENKKSGRVQIGENRMITEIHAYDENITTEE